MDTNITFKWNGVTIATEVFLLERPAVEDFLRANPEMAVLRQASPNAKEQAIQNNSEEPIAVLSYLTYSGTYGHYPITQTFMDTHDFAEYFPSKIKNWTTHVNGPIHATVKWNGKLSIVKVFLLERPEVEDYLRAHPHIAVLRQAKNALKELSLKNKEEKTIAVLSYIKSDGKYSHTVFSQTELDMYDLANKVPSTVKEWTTQLEGPTHIIRVPEPDHGLYGPIAVTAVAVPGEEAIPPGFMRLLNAPSVAEAAAAKAAAEGVEEAEEAEPGDVIVPPGFMLL
jgi:uncharacterized protein Usg